MDAGFVSGQEGGARAVVTALEEEFIHSNRSLPGRKV